MHGRVHGRVSCHGCGREERREKREDGKRKWEERVQGGVIAECAAKRVYVYQALRGRQRQVRGLSVAGKGGQRAVGWAAGCKL
jgi:hypothetical protein